jgi:uncharacterized protein YjbI with pentapeptide repeats
LKTTIARARLEDVNLYEADLSGANLREARLIRADLIGAKLNEADLREADLSGTKLRQSNLEGAKLHGASLNRTELIRTDISGANLTESSIYGIAAWEVKLASDTLQQNLIITPPHEPAIAVDNIKLLNSSTCSSTTRTFAMSSTQSLRKQY